MGKNHRPSIRGCLEALGITTEVLRDCDDLRAEFKTSKQIYFRKILREHPDKGGDATVFHKTQAAFEALRDYYNEGKVRSFLDTTTTNNDDDDIDDESFFRREAERASESSFRTPSYEYYTEAAREEVPAYRVEFAKSGRSKCFRCKTDGGKGKQCVLQPNPKPKPPKQTRCTTRAMSRALALSSSSLSNNEGTLLVDPFLIPKDDLRVGSLNDIAGSYGRWHHLPCWRIPNRIWAGFTDPENREAVWHDLLQMDQILLENVRCLETNEEAKQAFLDHIVNQKCWTRKPKKRSRAPRTDASSNNNKENNNSIVRPRKKRSSPKAKAATGSASSRKALAASSSSMTTAIIDLTTTLPTTESRALAVPKNSGKKKFSIPQPGKDGAAAANLYEGKRFVLTGTFPEIGGGIGLDLGKTRVKEMIESFGGRVTTAVSGKTDYLVVGKDPGRSKVTKADKKGVLRVDLKSLSDQIYGIVKSLELAPVPVIENFSAGYQHRYLGY